MVEALAPFSGGVWLVDFEFHSPSGERPDPICMVARELQSGLTIKLYQDELKTLSRPPFPTGPDALFVAYYASAELGCFQALGWPMPTRILDLCVEFKNLTSGEKVSCGRSLLGALTYFGLDGIDAMEKTSMRDLAIRGGPFTADERQSLSDYCQTDVIALEKLLQAMLPRIDLPRALLRGRYMAAAAKIEWTGVPIDVSLLQLLRARWPEIQEKLIARVDAEFGFYDGRTFKRDRFRNWLAKRQFSWPLLETSELDLSDKTFREMAKTHPILSPIRELRHTLSELRLESLNVGGDGRNRCLLSAFGSKTGRNQPSNSQFIFGPAVWLRCLIKPEQGQAIAYIDYQQQEFGIAAALSRDRAMETAYASGDPYLVFAKQARAVPANATEMTHPNERALFKACVLAVQYLMGANSLAQRIGQPEIIARELLRQHHETYSTFWHWSQGVVDHAMLHGWLQTVFGWHVHVGEEPNPRSLANFPMQANGAEILRLACCLATERGIRVCAPVHDALLIEAPVNGIEQAVVATQQAMAEASEIVLSGFRLRTKVEQVIHYPERFMDEKRGRKMWEIVMGILNESEAS